MDDIIHVEKHRCSLLTADGFVCGEVFSSWQSLVEHQVHSVGGEHGLRSKVSLATLSNTCVICASTLKTREIAIRHTNAALLMGRCQVDMGFVNSAIIDPSDYRCLLCQEEFDSFEEHNRHAVKHLPIDPEHRFEFSADGCVGSSRSELTRREVFERLRKTSWSGEPATHRSQLRSLLQRSEKRRATCTWRTWQRRPRLSLLESWGRS